jgi:hypothetical protein
MCIIYNPRGEIGRKKWLQVESMEQKDYIFDYVMFWLFFDRGIATEMMTTEIENLLYCDFKMANI